METNGERFERKLSRDCYAGIDISVNATSARLEVPAGMEIRCSFCGKHKDSRIFWLCLADRKAPIIYCAECELAELHCHPRVFPDEVECRGGEIVPACQHYVISEVIKNKYMPDMGEIITEDKLAEARDCINPFKEVAHE